MILACVRARGVYRAPISDTLHPRSQVAHLLRNLLMRGRITNNNLIQMIIHMVNTVCAICVIGLVGQICMICNVGPIRH